MSLFSELKRRNVIRVCTAYVVVAWLIIQVVETVLPAFGFGDAALRMATIVLIAGLVPTAVFAWAFELTPEGLKKEAELDRSRPVNRRSTRRLDRLIMVVLALGLGYFAVDKFVLAPERRAQELESAREEALADARDAQQAEDGKRSIAVLPFASVGGDEDDEVYTDGITEDLLILLGKVPELRTPSRNSVFRFKDSDEGIAGIAAQLNVRYILDGTVRRQGDMLRVTAQLVNVETDTALWSEGFNRTVDDIFAVQDEIAANVVRELKLKLLDEPPTTLKTSPEVYALFLQARHLNRRATPENIEEAERLLARAVSLDPGYAPAFEQLTTTWLNKVRRNMVAPEEGLATARQMAEKALAIEPGYALVHARLGILSIFQRPPDPAQSARHFKRALEIEPNNLIVLASTIFLLDNLHRTEDVLSLTQYVITRDPMDHVAHFNLGLTHFDLQQYRDAIEHFEVVHRLSPGVPLTSYYRGMSMLITGDALGAREVIAGEPVEVQRKAGLAAADCALGWEDQARSALDALDTTGDANLQVIAAAHAACGEIDQAFTLLWRDIETGGFVNDRFANDARFDKLHDDARWPRVLEAYAANHPVHPDVAFELPPLP